MDMYKHNTLFPSHSNVLTYEDGDDDHVVGLIVHDIEEDDHRLEDIEEHRANRETFQSLTTAPELHVCSNKSAPTIATTQPTMLLLHLTILKSKELEYTMQDTNGNSQSQQVRVGLQQRGLRDKWTTLQVSSMASSGSSTLSP